MAIELNWEHWPLRIDAVVGPPTTEEMAAYLSRAEELYQLGEEQVILFDLRYTKIPKGPVLSVITGHFRKQTDEIERAIAVGVLLVSSPVVRVALNTIFALTPCPSPIKFVSSIEDAIKALRPISEEHGFSLPEAALISLLQKERDSTPGIRITGQAPDGKSI